MLELTIKGSVYQFNFGMGFMREVNKKYQKPIDGLKDAKENVGLQMMVMGILAKDAEFLVEVLNAANIGKTPRVTKDLLDYYIDEECENIDVLFEQVLDFLKKKNATKNITLKLEEEQKKLEEEQKKQMQGQ